MKFLIVFVLISVVGWSEAMQISRLAGSEAIIQEEHCCYPRPPSRRTDRGLRKEVSRCCQMPTQQIWDKFVADVEACKEENKRKQAEQDNANNTTTQGPDVTETADEKENEVADNEFDAEDSIEAASGEIAEDSTVSSTISPKQSRHHGHKGRGKGGKHRGRGKCMKATMEKHGWSSNGTINWDVIAQNTKIPADSEVQAWILPVQEAIENCSKLTVVTPTQDDCPHKFSPERRAWRCIVNYSIMKCPSFPKNNEYCNELRDAHYNCLAKPHTIGPKQFQWCQSPNKKDKRQNKSIITAR